MFQRPWRARLVKDENEIARIREAARITCATIEDVPELLTTGMSERDLLAEVMYRLQRAGATGFAFDPIVAFGLNTAVPHHAPGDATLLPDSLVIVDLGARYRRYCADATRTSAFGEIGEVEKRMRAVVSESLDAAAANLVPGKSLRDVADSSRAVIENSEFAGRFMHAVGHSIGLEAHDGALVHRESDVVIEPGMVFAIEPGVYIPGDGGARTEDTFLVTDHGAEKLTSGAPARGCKG